MARFRGTVQGQRGSTSRLGSTRSGLTVEANGWNVGVRVQASADMGSDQLAVFATGGSNGGQRPVLLGFITAGIGSDLLFVPDLNKRDQGFVLTGESLFKSLGCR